MKPNRCHPQMMKNDQPVVLDGAVDLDQRKSLGCHIVILKCATPRVQCHLVAKIYPQVPDVQQMPLPGTWEAGEDLTQDPWPCHPWPWVLHCKTAECTCTGVPEEKPLVQTQKCFVLQHQGYQGSRHPQTSTASIGLAACVAGWAASQPAGIKSILAKSVDRTMQGCFNTPLPGPLCPPVCHFIQGIPAEKKTCW